MAPIGQHCKCDLFILVRPRHDTSGAVMSEAVAHLGTRTNSIETIRTGVLVTESSHSRSVLGGQCLRDDSGGLIGQLPLAE